MFLLSHLLRSAWHTLAQNCWSFPHSLQYGVPSSSKDAHAGKVMINMYLVNYSPFPKRWDSKCSSEWKSKSSMVIIGLFSKCSFEKRHELWPSMISICILTSILIAEALGLWSSCLYESWVIYKNLNICDQGFQISGISEVKTSWVLFKHFAMKECNQKPVRWRRA